MKKRVLLSVILLSILMSFIRLEAAVLNTPTSNLAQKDALKRESDIGEGIIYGTMAVALFYHMSSYPLAMGGIGSISAFQDWVSGDELSNTSKQCLVSALFNFVGAGLNFSREIIFVGNIVSLFAGVLWFPYEADHNAVDKEKISSGITTGITKGQTLALKTGASNSL